MLNKELVKSLNSQNGLYSLIMRDETDSKIEVVGSIKELIYPYEQNKDFSKEEIQPKKKTKENKNLLKTYNLLSSDSTKIISMTVTEKGYNQDLTTNLNDYKNKDIIHDLEFDLKKNSPKTLIGLLSESLNERYKSNSKGVTLLCCDNLTENGNFLKKMILDFLKNKNPKIINWLEEEISFPNSMVDRITPASKKENNNYIKKNFNIQDKNSIMSEKFSQWVIEDKFVQERPNWQNVGAQIVKDVIPYELTKLRILNGSHFALCHLAALKGYLEVHLAMKEEFIKNYLLGFMKDVEPSLSECGIDIERYKFIVISRFENFAIGDRIDRLLMDSSKKAFQLFPSMLRTIFENGGAFRNIAAVFATYIFCSLGKNELGESFFIEDPKFEELRRLADFCVGIHDSKEFISNVLGQDIASHQGFIDSVNEHLIRIKEINDIEQATKELCNK